MTYYVGILDGRGKVWGVRIPDLPGCVAAAETLMGGYEGERTSESLVAIEQAVQEILHAMGRCLVKEWVEAQAPKYPDAQVACGCGKQAHYVRQRDAVCPRDYN